jgi:hypothetical protein
MLARPPRHAPVLAIACALASFSACRSQTPDTAPRASIAVSPAQAAAEAGAPLDFEYRLSAVPGAPPLAGTYWVFVHMLDESGTLLWTDDHAPPTPPSSWTAAPLTYRRTMFVPRIPYAGRVRVEAGLFSRDDGTRVALAGTDRGGHAYDVAAFAVRPASNATFVSFGEGWYGAERDAGDAAHEWRWTMGDARLSFRNPRRDAVLWLELDQPVASVGPQSAELRAGADLLATIRVAPGARRVERVMLPAGRLGTAATVDLDLHVQPTFVPASTAGAASQDTRVLGVRVFNVYVGFP